MNSQPLIDALFERYLADALTPEDSAALTAALGTAEGQRRWRELSDLDGALADELGAPTTKMATEDRNVSLRDHNRERPSVATTNETVGEKSMTFPGLWNSMPSRFRVMSLGLAAALMAFLLGAVLLFANQPKFDPEIPSQAIAGLNDVIVESGQTLLLNAEEFFGRKILTQDDASAVITFTDGTKVVLESDTQVKLNIADPKRGKEFEMYAGQVGVGASPQPKDRPLKIRSPHGTVTVLGTEFLLNVTQQGTSIGLLEGVVNLTRHGDNAALQLFAGQRVTLAPEAALVATPLKFSNGQLWTPAEIRTSAWYDADDDSTIVATKGDRSRNGRDLGLKVSQLKDKSGNNHHLVAQGPGNGYLGKTSNFNGVIRFRNPPNFINTQTICAQPFSFAVVVNGPSKPFRHDTPLFDGNGTQRCMVMGSSNQVTMNAGHSGPNLKRGPGPFIATGVFNGASSTMQINGGSPAFGDAGSGDLSQGIAIGRSVDSDPNSPLQGNIGEIIIIPGVWSTAERQKVEGYLAHKWSIDLPASHPFKKTPPQK